MKFRLFLSLFFLCISLKSYEGPLSLSSISEEVPILMYHHIRIPPPGAKRLERTLTVTPIDFYQQMKALYERGYRTISLKELFSGKWEKKFIVTFDDGYKDVIEEAYPILASFGFKATIFVIVNEIGKPGHLDWQDIKFLESQGWEVGSHTLNHLNLTHLSTQDMWKEIYMSKSILEKKLGHPIDFISYPSGRFNDEVIKLVQLAGYKGAVSTIPGRVNKVEDIYKLKRVRVNGGTPLSFFIEKVIGTNNKYRAYVNKPKYAR